MHVAVVCDDNFRTKRFSSKNISTMIITVNVQILNFPKTELYYLDQTEIFCHRCASILGQLSCRFITYPAMDTTSPRVHPQSVLKSKVLWKHLTMHNVDPYNKYTFAKFPFFFQIMYYIEMENQNLQYYGGYTLI